MSIMLKILTLISALFFGASSLLASTVDITSLKTHLRLSVRGQEEALRIDKSPKVVRLKTLNQKLFDGIKKDLSQNKIHNEYIKNIEYQGDSFPSKPLTVAIYLNNPAVEAFNFFRKADGKHIIDFWINTDLVSHKKSSVTGANKIFKKAAPKLTKKKMVLKKKPVNLFGAKKVEKAKRAVQKNSLYRDFRYGASFVWDYPAMMPRYQRDLNLAKKTPDYLYPIRDREYEKDKKETHMQLTINLLKKEKWGHLNKSIRLYEKKYGRDTNKDLNDFIKIVALLKENRKNKDKNIHRTTMAMLNNLAESTSNYLLKSACYRYLIQNSFDKDNKLALLRHSKKLYVLAKTEIDDDITIIAIRGILHALTKMNQLDQLKKFLKEKTVQRILPKQISLSYQTFILLSQNKTEDLIKLYNSVKKSLVAPVSSAILFNVAEAHFRRSAFQRAIRLFDQFLKDYNHLSNASYARLRVALSYDFLDKKTAKVLELYAQAINRSAVAKVRYEAKLRYVGLRVARKLEPSEEDFEHEVFLEPTNDEKSEIQGEIKRLLWLTRLRTLIVKKEFPEAMAYYNAIPLDSIPLDQKKVFSGDGQEVLLGNLKKLFSNALYGEVVKRWELYKKTIGKNLVKDAFAGHIILSSYLNLGLTKHFEKYLSKIKGIQNTTPYPLWIERNNKLNIQDIIAEMNIRRYIRRGDYVKAQKILNKMPSKKTEKEFYQGVIGFKKKEYKQAIKSFEGVLVKEKISLSNSEKKELALDLLESFYQVSNYKKFKTYAGALTKDLAKYQGPGANKVLERINYLHIEVLAADSLSSRSELINRSRDFVRKFKTSNYESRVKYLLGTSLIKTNEKNEGKKVLSEIIDDKESPAYIKEQAKSDLAELELEKKL